MRKLILGIFGIATAIAAAGNTNARADSFSVEISKRLSSIAAHCERATKDTVASELVACPVLKTVVMDQASANSVSQLNRLSDRHSEWPSLDLASASVGRAKKVILSRLQSQIDGIEGDTPSQRSALRSLNKMVVELEDYLNSKAAEGANLYVDANTYWAPSVNAAALVIVDAPRSPDAKVRVTLILHGDTDG